MGVLEIKKDGECSIVLVSEITDQRKRLSTEAENLESRFPLEVFADYKNFFDYRVKPAEKIKMKRREKIAKKSIVETIKKQLNHISNFYLVFFCTFGLL